MVIEKRLPFAARSFFRILQGLATCVPFRKLLDHVVALIYEHLDAETIADSSERGSQHLCEIICGRVEGVASAISRRVALSPVAEISK